MEAVPLHDFLILDQVGYRGPKPNLILTLNELKKNNPNPTPNTNPNPNPKPNPKWPEKLTLLNLTPNINPNPITLTLT